MNITKATASYEKWIRNYTPLLEDDLALKHEHMARDPFLFFRGTFYRWAQTFDALCPDAAKAPVVLAVGDLHIENFGTWRDAEGRLVWGVNDFDEAARLPYTNDLVRLLVSAQLAGEANHLHITADDAGAAILHGYTAGLTAGSEPFVLDQDHPDLRAMATSVLRDPAHFWGAMHALPDADKAHIPTHALRALADTLPRGSTPPRYKRRVAGMGSLGHPRFCAIARFEGGDVCRETRPLTPSTDQWVNGTTDPPLYNVIVSGAVRAQDPFLSFHAGWIARRLAPFCTRIELAGLDNSFPQHKPVYCYP